MTGVSSETRYLNIGTVETSTHPEIEPEIEDVQATRDSDEVSKVDKTKKPRPPASKCTNKGLREATDDSDWYHALELQDCNELMALLQANPCLVAQTGPEGRTVLHVAAGRGCMQLLDQVFDIFEDEQVLNVDKIQFVDEASGVNLYLNDLLNAKCGVYEALAEDMASFIDYWAWWILADGRRSGKRFSLVPKLTSNASQPWRDTLVEIMSGEPAKEAFKGLEEFYQADLNYNFVRERKELQFHHACQYLFFDEAINYVKTIIAECLKLGPSESVKVLTYLFQLRNAQGQTPFHVHVAMETTFLNMLLVIMPSDHAYKECLNAKDARGWTTLHYVVASRQHHVLEALLKDERIDTNTRTNTSKTHIKEDGVTALHLAILHDDVTSVKLLLKCPRTDVNALLCRWVACGHERMRSNDDSEKLQEEMYWSPLQLATIMGLSHVVRVLLASDEKLCDIYDDEKFQNNNTGKKLFPKMSTILLACASGNPDTLRLFLDNSKFIEFDPLVKFEGATALHYATNATIPMAKNEGQFRSYMVGPILYFSDLGYLDRNTHRYEEETKDKKLTPTSYLGRQACIIMLLQVGVDIWEKDNYGRLADPGPQAPKEALLWWHEQMARETLEAKKSLNDAANAISVVAALVATASFVGPLQPPLGYGGDLVEGGVQDTHLSVRVFMVSNILSFYFAVASIMFAVVPSLPMPQEGIYLEWQRTRRSVGVAIFFLLMSVLGVLISFGTASNSVVSEDYSWQHAGLSFYPTLLGGIICILGIILLFIRLLRLVFHRNANIRSLYKTFVKF